MSAREIPLKQWVSELAMAERCSTRSVYMRLSRGQIKYPPVRRVNARVIWVQVGPEPDPRQIVMPI